MATQQADTSLGAADTQAAIRELANATAEVASILRELSQMLPKVVPAVRPPWGEGGIHDLASRLALAAIKVDHHSGWARALAEDVQ